MKNNAILAATIATLFINQAHAEEAQADHAWSANAAAFSDYRYRGISQTRLQPALSGGADYSHAPTGLYAGVWASTVKWTNDAGGNGSVEIDLYAGKRGTLSERFSYDAGVLRYVYPSNALAQVAGLANANTTELYGQLNYGTVYLKYSHSTTNLFGFVNSKGSGYLDLGSNVALNQTSTLNLHLGHQAVRNTAAARYTDWKVGVTREMGFASVSLALIGTNAGKSAYASPANGKFLGRTALVLGMSKTF